MSFRDCLAAALKEGLISKEDHDRLAERHAQLSKDDPLNARSRLGAEERARAANAKRVAFLQIKAQRLLYRDIKSATLLSAERNQGPDLPAAIFGLFENITGKGVLSARGIGDQLLAEASNDLAQMLEKFRRGAWTRRRFNRPLLDDVVRAGWGENVSEPAKAFYGAWRTVAEKLRERYNQAGGHIGWREDYGFPTAHDAHPIKRAGFEKWGGFIGPKIDWEKMAHVFDGSPILASERDGILRHVFESVTQNGWNKRGLEGSVSHGRSYANRRADPRFLVFKSADDWLDYQRAYGGGEPFQVMMGHIVSMSRDVALMERFGPNPFSAKEWLKTLATREANLYGGGAPSLFGGNTENVQSRAKSAISMIDGFYDVAAGVGAPRSPMGDTVAIAKNSSYGGLLGSTILTDIVVNPAVQLMMGKVHALPAARIARNMLENLSVQTGNLVGRRRQIANAHMIAEDMLHTLERGAREQAALSRIREFSRWLPEWTMHYSGANGFNKALRAVPSQSLMGETAGHLSTEWSALPERFRDLVKGYAITAEDWAIMRQASPDQPAPHAAFLRPRDIAALGPEAEATATKYGAMLTAIAETLQPQSNWYAKAFGAAHRLDDPGTVAGALYSSAEMFHSGWWATSLMTQWASIEREFTMRGKWSGALHLSVYLPVMMLAGTVAWQLRQLAAGKDLAPMDPTTHEGRITYAKGLVTSGGAILLGDLLSAEVSSHGRGFAGTLVGTITSDALDAVKAAFAPFQALDDWLRGKEVKWSPGHQAVNALRYHTPLLSTLWATRAAYHRVILDQLDYALDPEAHSRFRRMESTLQRETGQGFWWRPGEAAPERLPELAR